MIAMLLASLAVPGAFEDDALLFACAYLGVRLMHIALFAAGSEHVDVRQAARALVPTVDARAGAADRRERARRRPPRSRCGSSRCAIDYVGGGGARDRAAGGSRPATSPSATA